MIYDDYNHATERKCAACDKIAPLRESFWQFAANLPFHYVCSDQCAVNLKLILETNKLTKNSRLRQP